MATQAIEQAAGSEPGAAAPKRRRPIVLILAIVGILAGGGVGQFLVGPVLAKRRAAAPAAKSAESSGPSIVHPIENLVLNPAGSGGTRFLMVTATFELRDGSVDQAMKDREAEVRDHILALLGKKTVDELTDFTKRDSIKAEVLHEVQSLFPQGDVRQVFFPQFVIQ